MSYLTGCGAVPSVDHYLSQPINAPQFTIEKMIEVGEDIYHRNETRLRTGEGGRVNMRTHNRNSYEIVKQKDGGYLLYITGIIKPGCIVIYHADSERVLRSYEIPFPSKCL